MIKVASLVGVSFILAFVGGYLAGSYSLDKKAQEAFDAGYLKGNLAGINVRDGLNDKLVSDYNELLVQHAQLSLEHLTAIGTMEAYYEECNKKCSLSK